MKELDGDYKLNKIDQVWYLISNFFRGIWGYRTLTKTCFWHKKLEGLNSHSPGRQYLDAFLEAQIPKLLKNKNISVLDIGCGTGYMKEVLEKYGYTGKYIGVDVMREDKFIEESKSFDVKFVESKIEDFNIDERFDLVISNTAFEHIPDDHKAAEQAHKYAGTRGIQLHIVPTFWSLPIYLFHGFRQYSPDRVKKLFGKKAIVYRLGGLPSFLTAFFMMTVPERLTGSRKVRSTNLYKKVMKASNKMDRFLPFCSHMYGVLIPAKDEK